MPQLKIEGKIVDIFHREIFEGTVSVEDGCIKGIKREPTNSNQYILPGFIDSHVHMESSMLTPEKFGQLAISNGTVGVVTDPHEIANVMGIEGIEFMIYNSHYSPIKTYFTISSCVPGTPFDISGGIVDAKDVERFAESGRFVGLSEMMNVPGVLMEDPEVINKLNIAKKYNLPIDGHAPVLHGEDLKKYISKGITTDHECTMLDEAKEKIEAGMNVQIRWGSAARNYDALHPLIALYPENIMFCTDDSHPDELIEKGEINKIVKQAVADGYDLFDVLRAASLNAVKHYKLDVGLLRKGDKGDFIIVDNLKDFKIKKVYIDGECRFDADNPIKEQEGSILYLSLNRFYHDIIFPESLEKKVKGEISVIGLIKDELLTSWDHYNSSDVLQNLESDISQDVIKIVYINRYINGTPQVAFCRGIGLKKGAFASSISHDSHNIIAVGCSDVDLANAINSVIKQHGGLAVSYDNVTKELPLPIAGIMSTANGKTVAHKYNELSQLVNELGSPLSAPFMTLAFLSLVVIPEVKISEKGLFSYSKFGWIKE